MDHNTSAHQDSESILVSYISDPIHTGFLCDSRTIERTEGNTGRYFRHLSVDELNTESWVGITFPDFLSRIWLLVNKTMKEEWRVLIPNEFQPLRLNGLQLPFRRLLYIIRAACILQRNQDGTDFSIPFFIFIREWREETHLFTSLEQQV
jgi:hypothetical protein